MANLLDEPILPRLEEWMLPLDGRLIRLEGETLEPKRANRGPVVRYRVVAIEPVRQSATTKQGQPATPAYKDVAGLLSGYLYDYEITGKNKAGVLPQTPAHQRLRAKRLELLVRRAPASEYISEMSAEALGMTVKVVAYKATRLDGGTYDSYYIELQ